MTVNPLMRVAIRLTGASIVVAAFLQLSNGNAHHAKDEQTDANRILVTSEISTPASTVRTSQ